MSARTPPAWRRYLRFWGADTRRDVDDELSFHIEMRAAEYERSGLDPAEARRRAEDRFGSVDRTRGECVTIQTDYAQREGRTQMIATLVQDSAYALRVLRRQWIPATAAVVCLALGISATAGMFSIVDRLLLRPLPYPNGDRLVAIGSVGKDRNRAGVSSYLDFLDWSASQHSFADLAAMGQTDFVMMRTEASRVSSALVSANFFRTFGVSTDHGRTFTEADDRLGAPPVVVVSSSFARREFGEPSRAVGQSIVLNGAARTIIGVLRDEWRYPSRTEAWLPIETGGYSAARRKVDHRGERNLEIFGALRPGVTADAANRDLVAIAERLAREYLESNVGVSTVVTPLRERYVGPARPAMTAMIAATLLVLVIACSNVAALQLARSTSRLREISVRVAIGAGRGRIVRQLLTESVILALIGGAAGAILTYWSRAFLARAVLTSTPAWMTFDIDARVLVVAFVLSAASGVIFGIAPALRLGRVPPAHALRAGAATSARVGLQRTFVVVEIALSVTLVVGAVLALESVARIQRIPLGIDPTGVITFRLPMQGARYNDPPARAAFVDNVIARLGALPGVAEAGAVDRPPIIGCCSHFGTHIIGQESDAAHKPMITGSIVTPGYFDALGIRLIAGRLFNDADDARAPKVTLINESFAKRYWPSGNAIGHLIDAGIGESQIVGIVADIREEGLLDAPAPQFFRPYAEDPWTQVSVMVRTHGDTSGIVAAARKVVHDIDPTTPLYNVQTMGSIIDGVMASNREFRNLLGAFAIVALLLAVAGLYGITAFVVAQRTREIGLRVALGAEPSRVAALILRQAAALAVTGAAIGVVGAIAAARWLSSTMYGVTASETSVYAAAAIALGVATIAAAWGPARRAARIDPVRALRVE
jgi:putative ABC transport system permease protein